MTTTEERLAKAEAKIEALITDLGIHKDVLAIRELQFAYGYFMDKFLFPEIVDLFSENAELHFKGGVFHGKAGAKRLYSGAPGDGGPEYGMLFEHIMAQDIIHVAPDRQSAKGRFRVFLQGGVHISKEEQPPVKPAQFLEGGLYENEFILEDGIWKISKFDYNVVWRCSFDDGWRHAPIPPVDMIKHEKTFPESPSGPDELEDILPRWPEPAMVPFHFKHPVTGKTIALPKT